MGRATAAFEAASPTRDVVPLYHRVYVILQQKISDGSYPPGESMPSEDELAGAFGVSRVTIRKAMERLEREGRVLRQRGRGTFPLPPAPPGGCLRRSSSQAARQTRRRRLSVAGRFIRASLRVSTRSLPPRRDREWAVVSMDRRRKNRSVGPAVAG